VLKLIRAFVSPAGKLLRPLRLVWKVLIVVVVLETPLVIILTAYTTSHSQLQDFTAQELIGVRYEAPALNLLNGVELAMYNASNGVPLGSGLATAISGVNTVNSQIGGQLTGVASLWAAAEAAVASAENSPTSAGGATYNAWNTAATAVLAVIDKAEDSSNLTLEPSAVIYFSQDASIVQLPNYVADLAQVTNLGSFDKTLSVDKALAQGAADSALRAATSDMNKVATDAAVPGNGSIQQFHTVNPNLQATFAPLLQQMTVTGNSLPRTISAAGQLETVLLNELNLQLNARVHSLTSSSVENELLALAALLIALWLLAGFLFEASSATKQLVQSTSKVAEGDVTSSVEIGGNDEFGIIGKHLNAALTRIRDGLSVISTNADTIADASTRLSDASSTMTTAAEKTSTQASAASSAGQQVNANVTMVATAIEELTVSIREIALSASRASEVAGRAAEIASVASGNILRLETSSAEIGQVVNLITSIAAQTKLLALNATIEAARAGAAGKGFGVVADEVKDLAAETAQATEDISRRIGAIQADSRDAIESIAKVQQIVIEIDQIQGSIATSVEEQSVVVGEVAKSIAEAATGTAEIARNVSGVAEAAQDTTSGATQNMASVDQLNQMSARLEATLRLFNFSDGNGSNGSDGSGS
jgi:methyl-accepting chemotaxis protein